MEQTTSSELRVKLPVFEGPLDLLLYLIKKDELDIYDIPIEQITAQYLEYLQLMKMMNLDIAGEFLVVASTLLYIKSRELLPKEFQPPEEEADEEDPRWELIRQLVEYKKFKDAAFELQNRQLEQEKIFRRGGLRVEVPVVSEPAGGLGDVALFDLIAAFQKILSKASEREELTEIFEERFTVSDKIQAIRERLESQERIVFSSLFPDGSSRTEIVVTFLALLELIRMRQARVVQGDSFTEIEIHRSLETDPLFMRPEVVAEKEPEQNPELGDLYGTETNT
jgi:segregation and condensation protein A